MALDNIYAENETFDLLQKTDENSKTSLLSNIVAS